MTHLDKEIELIGNEPDSLGAPDFECARLAVLIPCYNEELTIVDTICGFRNSLPTAVIYVCDNNSSDQTARLAREAGAVVFCETRQGKGNAVRRLFSDIEADVYLLVDGDATYDPSVAPSMLVRMVSGNVDFLNGARVTEVVEAYRPGHKLGNRVLSDLVQGMFGRQFEDMLSGYKLMSRRFVKSFPAISSGFEIETELCVHALSLRMTCLEVATRYSERPDGSVSKLKTYRDGARILRLIFNLVRHERPLLFFGSACTALMIIALILSIPLVTTFAATGLVPRLPTAVLVVGLGITGLLSLFAGMILDTISGSRHEMKRLAYLSIPALQHTCRLSDGPSKV